MPQPEPQIVFEGIVKRFPLPGHASVDALNNFSFSVQRGELAVLAGPSGSGKTTALRLLAGLETQDAGSIRVGGSDMKNVQPKDRGVGMVFQNYTLYPHLTARQNLAFGLEIQKTPKAQIERRIEVVAATLHLDGLLDKMPNTLSGGERQRVAIARALVPEPKILLLDEPFSNLDPPLRAELRRELRRLQRQLDLTILLVTHDHYDAMALGETAAVIRRGSVEQAGTPARIYRAPANLFVAGFFGEMNLIPARISADGRTVIIRSKAENLMSWDLPAFFASGLGNANRDVIVGFRPHAARLAQDCAGKGAYGPALPLEVSGSEFAGPFTHVYGAMGGHAVTARFPEWECASAIAEIRVKLEDMALFDPATGLRIE